MYDINTTNGDERLNEFIIFFKLYERIKQLLGALVDLKQLDGKVLGPSFSIMGQIGQHGRRWYNYTKTYNNSGKKIPSVVKEDEPF